MRKIVIGILLYPGFQLLDIAGPRNAFGQVQVQGEYPYEIVTIATTRLSLRSACGLAVIADHHIFEPCPTLDTLIVPGGAGVFDVYEDRTLTDWLGGHVARWRRLAAICNGVFVLGGAGLIERRQVTSHWADVPRLRAAYPRARLRPDAIRLKDGRLYTSAGASASIDLALLLIEEDFGRPVARKVAKYLLVYLERPGAQGQFQPLVSRRPAADGQVQVLRDYVLAHLDTPHSLASLASRIHMSPRNLTRLFSKQLGTTPMAFVSEARIDAARDLLENTELSIADIARRCGVESADSLRRLFSKRLGVSPLDYRQRFGSASSLSPASPGKTCSLTPLQA